MKSKNSGQIIIEVLVSAALFSLLAFSVATVLKDMLNVLVNGMKKQEAVYLAKEGLEAVRAIAQDDFSKLKNGSYGIEALNGRWELSEESQKESGFLRQIKIEDYKNFEGVKKVEVKIGWEGSQFGDENSLALSEFFTDQKIFALNLNPASYLTGDPTPWQGLAYTIVLSIKPEGTLQEEGACLFANQDASQGETPQLLQIESDGSSNYQLRIGEDAFLIGPILDKWTQLVITWDGANVTTYYNSEEATSQSLAPEKGTTLFKAYLLGISSDKTKSFKGDYKNLMIFERALNQKEILDLFSGKLPSLEGLKLYWKMNEGKESLVKDYGPFNVLGNITGQPLWKKVLTFSSFKEVADF
jgi:hypothetical protein